jgi:hypothetical protein
MNLAVRLLLFLVFNAVAVAVMTLPYYLAIPTSSLELANR